MSNLHKKVKTLVIAFGLETTLLGDNDVPNILAINLLVLLATRGYNTIIIVVSSESEEYARRWVSRLELGNYVDGVYFNGDDQMPHADLAFNDLGDSLVLGADKTIRIRKAQEGNTRRYNRKMRLEGIKNITLIDK